jgi:hypothetical protein
MSRECPEPRDWSKVQCSTCQEFGHTYKRCKAPAANEGGDDAGMADGGPVGGWSAGDDAGASGGDGGWNAGGDAGGASGGW